MERIRIDRRVLSLRARDRAARHVQVAPLVYATGGGPEVDEDLLARIDVLLAAPTARATAHRTTPPGSRPQRHA